MSNVPLYPRAAGSVAPGLVAEIWGQSVQAYVSNDPAFGVRTKLRPAEFSPLPLTGTTSATHAQGWTAQDAVQTNGTYAVTDAAQPKGQLAVANGATDADSGCEFGGSVLAHATPKHASAPSNRFNFQAFVDPVAVNGQVLAGMTSAGAATPVCGANDAVADHGFIGFQVNEAGHLNFLTKSATSGTAGSVQVLAAGAWTPLDPHVLAFAVDKTGKVTISVDNVLYSAKAAQVNPASIPTGTLRPVLACTSSGSTAASMRVGDVDIFSEYAS